MGSPAFFFFLRLGTSNLLSCTCAAVRIESCRGSVIKAISCFVLLYCLRAHAMLRRTT